MLHSRPVIACSIGVFPEFIQEGVTGLLSTPGDTEDLSKKIRHLWERPELCHKMGLTGRTKALSEYSPKRYYERLMKVFNKVT